MMMVVPSGEGFKYKLDLQAFGARLRA